MSREELLRLAQLAGTGSIYADGFKMLQENDAALRAEVRKWQEAYEAEKVRHDQMTRLFDESDAAVREKDARIATLEADLSKSRLAEMRSYAASPAMKTFADLKHSQAGSVLAMLGDGAISRGKCCEALAQLAHGVPFDEIPLPQEHGRQFSLDEIPAEVVAKAEGELTTLQTAAAFAVEVFSQNVFDELSADERRACTMLKLALAPSGEAPTATRNSVALDSFVAYYRSNPTHRFWQALRDWSGFAFILAAETRDGGTLDTFYLEGLDGTRHSGEAPTAPAEPERLWRTAWEWATSGLLAYSPVTSSEKDAREATNALRDSADNCPRPIVKNPRVQSSTDGGKTWRDVK